MNNQTEIRTFKALDRIYRHILDLTDDSITLKDDRDNTLIVYTSDSEVLLKGETKIGRFRLNSNSYWEFVNLNDEVYDSKYHIDEVEGLLDFEVEISIILISYLDSIENKTPERLMNDRTIPFYSEISRMPIRQVKELAETMTSASLALELGTDYKRIFTKAKNKRKAGSLRRIYEYFEGLDRGRIEILSRALSQLQGLNEQQDTAKLDSNISSASVELPSYVDDVTQSTVDK